MSRIPSAVVDEVLARAAGYCECCGRRATDPMDLHHRKARSQGGRDEAVNLLWCHHLCHVLSSYSIHQNPARSRDLGHIVRRGDDPASVPVQLLGRAS